VGSLRLVADPRALVAPAAFLLAVTVAVVLLHSTRGGAVPARGPDHPRPAAKPASAPARFYRVAPGDTLVAIAAKTHVSFERIRVLNPGVRPTALFIGEKIRLR